MPFYFLPGYKISKNHFIKVHALVHYTRDPEGAQCLRESVHISVKPKHVRVTMFM